MIRTKTLFILGAGASVPFAYPTGIELRNLIRKGDRRNIILDTLTPVNNDGSSYERLVNEFIADFSKSGLYSIDFFLEGRPEFMDIGKITIASYLIPYEIDSKLRDSDGNWYMYLYDRLKSSFEDFNKNEVSFITFNYDRSLEQFLFEALKSQFNKSPQECAKKLENIPIVHLYGQLDFLPWQDENGNPYTPSEDNIRIRLRKAQESIKLITEEREVEGNKEFLEAYKLIKRVDKIYILGFGFDETNLERLNLSLMRDKIIIATGYGLEKSKRRWVERYFQSKINTDIFLSESDTLSLLKENLQIE